MGERKKVRSLSFVGRGFEEKNNRVKENKPLPSQHITEEPPTKEGVLVPLDLPELHILSQERRENGTLRIGVIATTTQVACPHCQKMCVKIHDTRKRKKRDSSLQGHQVELRMSSPTGKNAVTKLRPPLVLTSRASWRIPSLSGST